MMTFKERYAQTVESASERYPALGEIDKTINELESDKNESSRQKKREYQLLKILKERAYEEFEVAQWLRESRK